MTSNERNTLRSCASESEIEDMVATGNFHPGKEYNVDMEVRSAFVSLGELREYLKLLTPVKASKARLADNRYWQDVIPKYRGNDAAIAFGMTIEEAEEVAHLLNCRIPFEEELEALLVAHNRRRVYASAELIRAPQLGLADAITSALRCGSLPFQEWLDFSALPPILVKVRQNPIQLHEDTYAIKPGGLLYPWYHIGARVKQCYFSLDYLSSRQGPFSQMERVERLYQFALLLVKD